MEGELKLNVPTSDDIASWYLRLNGCLHFRNYVFHRLTGGGQRAEADFLGVRFPFRAELVETGEALPDDERFVGTRIDIVFGEAKRRQPCDLNSSWQDPGRRPVEYALEAIGIFPDQLIAAVAAAIYKNSIYLDDGFRVRFFAFGSATNKELPSAVEQVVWPDALKFIHGRLNHYGRYKKQVDQWDEAGQFFHNLAQKTRKKPAEFVRLALRAI